MSESLRLGLRRARRREVHVRSTLAPVTFSARGSGAIADRLRGATMIQAHDGAAEGWKRRGGASLSNDHHSRRPRQRRSPEKAYALSSLEGAIVGFAFVSCCFASPL